MNLFCLGNRAWIFYPIFSKSDAAFKDQTPNVSKVIQRTKCYLFFSITPLTCTDITSVIVVSIVSLFVAFHSLCLLSWNVGRAGLTRWPWPSGRWWNRRPSGESAAWRTLHFFVVKCWYFPIGSCDLYECWWQYAISSYLEMKPYHLCNL